MVGMVEANKTNRPMIGPEGLDVWKRCPEHKPFTLVRRLRRSMTRVRRFGDSLLRTATPLSMKCRSELDALYIFR